MNQNIVKINIDEVTFELQEQHDFTWLHALGTVFCVFDEQDSGNISFGIIQNGVKRFVKYAGCKPMDFSGDPRDAITRLSHAMPLYSTLEHPYLIKLIEHYETKSGYIAIFDWFDGECMHSHWLYAGEAKYSHPESPFHKFKQLSIKERVEALDAIFEFHEYVESKGYVAVDFYDGSILYDFNSHSTMICDIDFYRRAPTVNDMGENFWGARRSKAPEEFIYGATIDAITNVYTMGAISFGLLGGEMDHSYSKWEAHKELYEVALRAVSVQREERYPTFKAFRQAWDAVK